jgi:hypothetical protein
MNTHQPRIHTLTGAAWYNGTRLHSSLEYRSPTDYENNHHENVMQVARPLINPVRQSGATSLCGDHRWWATEAE